MTDYTMLSDGALVLKFKDICTRIGKLEEKAHLAALYGQTMAVPESLYADQADLGGELVRRLYS